MTRTWPDTGTTGGASTAIGDFPNLILAERGGIPFLAFDASFVLESGASVFAALLDALPRSHANAERVTIHEGLRG